MKPFPLLKSVCTRKTWLFIYVLFLLVFTFVNLLPFAMFLYRTMFSSFPNSIENHAHYRVSTSVCHLWGPEKRVSCHPLTGLIWAGMWGWGAFWTQKISNLNVFTYWKTAENDWLIFWTFLCWSLFAQERHVHLYILLVSCLYIWKPFSIPGVSYIGRCFRVFQILLKITPTAHLHPQCVGTKKTCNMSAIDKAHFWPGCGGGLSEPKQAPIWTFSHIEK